jgi:SPX domain protein involved in polyphosphate accumulation
MSQPVTSAANRYRYERKFTTSRLGRDEVEHMIRMNPAMFSEIFRERWVNNIYFDSMSMTNLHANLSGVQHRVKCRIRWYGDLFGQVEKPVFEVKKKNGLMGAKDSFPLPPFDLDEDLRPTDLVDVLAASDIPDWLRARCLFLEPALLNRYRRKYFRSADDDYRITVDTDLEYYRIDRCANRFRESMTDEWMVIVELKYARERDAKADRITSRFPLRLARISKYVDGVGRLHRF